MLRAWRTEFRRSVGLPLLIVAVPLGLWLLLIHTEWAADWMVLATYHRFVVIINGSLVVTVAAWYAAREHRRGTLDLLNATPTSRWKRQLMQVSTVCVAAVVAHLLAFAVAAFFVVRQTDYIGGGWWWVLLLSCLGLVALAAVGWAIGIMLPYRLTAPLAGLATYVATGLLTWKQRSWTHLLPAGQDGVGSGTSPTGLSIVLTAVFLCAVAAGAFWLVAGEGRVVWGAVALTGAVVMAAAVSGTDYDFWYVEDPLANALVCNDAEPTVCVRTPNAKFLDSSAEALAPAMARMGDLTPARVHESQYDSGGRPDPDVLEFSLYDRIPLTGAEILRPNELRRETLSSPLLSCYEDDDDWEEHEAVWNAEAAATTILWGEFEGAVWEGTSAGLLRLHQATDEQQQDFVVSFFELARECDWDALDELARTWQPK